jgi:hypothetical protein
MCMVGLVGRSGTERRRPRVQGTGVHGTTVQGTEFREMECGADRRLFGFCFFWFQYSIEMPILNTNTGISGTILELRLSLTNLSINKST